MDGDGTRTLGALLDEGLLEGVWLEDQWVEEGWGRWIRGGVEDGAWRGLELPCEQAEAWGAW